MFFDKYISKTRKEVKDMRISNVCVMFCKGISPKTALTESQEFSDFVSLIREIKSIYGVNIDIDINIH